MIQNVNAGEWDAVIKKILKLVLVDGIEKLECFYEILFLQRAFGSLSLRYKRNLNI